MATFKEGWDQQFFIGNKRQRWSDQISLIYFIQCFVALIFKKITRRKDWRRGGEGGGYKVTCCVSDYDRGHDTVILSPGSYSDSCQIPHGLPPTLTSPASLCLTFLVSPIGAFNETFPHLTFLPGISAKLTSVEKTYINPGEMSIYFLHFNVK